MSMLITDPNELKKYAPEYRLWQGVSSIEVTPNERHFCTFYSGGTMEEIGNFVMLFISEDGVDYSRMIAVCYEEGQRYYDPNLWIDPLGRLWFIWSRLPDYGVFAAICEDPDAENIVFGEPFCITREANVMMNKPTVLSTGEWLFPCALWQPYLMKGCWGVALPEGTPVGAFAVKSSDNGKTFIRMGAPKQTGDYSFEEQMILEKQDGTLAMYVRTHYGIGISYSYDRGESWTDLKNSGIVGPDSRFHIRRLASGRVLLVNNNPKKPRMRHNMTAFLSEDDGASFPYSILLDERNQTSYPDCAIAPDGGIVVTYDRERGAWAPSFEGLYSAAREILTARITEEDIIAGKLVSERSYLKRTVSRLGKYAHDDQNIYGEWSRFTNREAAEQIAKKEKKDAILSELFTRYTIPCFRANGVDIERLDALTKEFNSKDGVDLDLLTAMVATVRMGSATQNEDIPVVARIKSFIEKHYTEDISSDMLAKHLGISLYYMLHLFKSATGTTISAYRRALKIMAAKKLLLGSDKKISDVAFECGYIDANYFTRVFTESEGISPSEYRNLHKK